MGSWWSTGGSFIDNQGQRHSKVAKVWHIRAMIGLKHEDRYPIHSKSDRELVEPLRKTFPCLGSIFERNEDQNGFSLLRSARSPPWLTVE